ncbi:unnamed protein product [Caenorhabditis angaria]|uniref:Uncharacterized protein n=1 Tax=Caenorhabditis angaria TaxID=860376 RepID=A0A9P1I3T6_9PELO|nr:unnamed protein product [Caenorhabditis angaria]
MALVLVMGIPASGKSTFCQKMRDFEPELVATTSFDEFRQGVNGDGSARVTRKFFKNHCTSIIPSSNEPIQFIEDIFYLQSMRRPFQKLARNQNFSFHVIFLKFDVEEAMRRNSKRSGDLRHPDETILKIDENLEFSDDFTVVSSEESRSLTLHQLFHQKL